MKRVINFYASVMLSVTCVGGLTAQDGIFHSEFSCLFAKNHRVGTCCGGQCEKEVGLLIPKTILKRMECPRLNLASYNSDKLCICKMVQLASATMRSKLKPSSTVSIGYQLEKHPTPFDLGSAGALNMPARGLLARLNTEK